MARKTGKTFRLILRALEYGSVGQTVIFVVSTKEEIKRVSSAMMKMANSYLTNDFITKAGKGRYLLGSGGAIHFCLESKRGEVANASRRPVKLIEDLNAGA